MLYVRCLQTIMSKLISEALRIIDQEINAVTRKEYLATQQAKQQALDEAAADDDSEDVAPPQEEDEAGSRAAIALLGRRKHRTC